MVCVFFLAADFSKYALGFFQLASMAELAIVVRHSANQMKIIQATDTLLVEDSQRVSFGANNIRQPSDSLAQDSLQIDTPADTDPSEDQDLRESFSKERERRDRASFDL